MPIGLSIPRADGASKVTGAALYADDIRPEGCWYGATVRSQRPHARILSIELDSSFDWTDVALVTAKDIPGVNILALITEDQPVLCDGLTRHMAEPVALVAAPTRDRALAAAKAVKVTYEDLPFNLDAEAAEGHEQAIYGTDNVFKRLTISRDGPIRSTPSRHVHEGVYHLGLQEQLYIEPQGILAIPGENGAPGHYRIRSQDPSPPDSRPAVIAFRPGRLQGGGVEPGFRASAQRQALHKPQRFL